MAPKYQGFEVVIYSSRSKSTKGIKAMKSWLIDNGLHPAYIDENILKFPTKKTPAYLTIDDRCICFNGIFLSNDELKSFKPWNKK